MTIQRYFFQCHRKTLQDFSLSNIMGPKMKVPYVKD